MKTKFKNLLYVVLITSFFGCNDAIDIDQPGRLGADNAFQQVSDLQSGLFGAYEQLDTSFEIGLTSAITDETFRGPGNGGQNDSEQVFNLNATNGYVANIWASYYGAIGLSNRIIEASTTIVPALDEVNTFNDILGQAYAIRAYSHFKIMTYFSTDIQDDSALAGVLLNTVTDDVFANPPRSTNGQFAAQIQSDIQTAQGLLNQDNGNTFFGLDAVKALQARMAAYRGNYSLADTLASELLADFPIADQAQYTSMYDDADETENIFKLARVVNGPKDGQGTQGGGWIGSLYAFVNASAAGGPFMEMSRSVFNIMEGSTDVRLSRNLNIAESTIDPGYASNPGFINSDQLLIFKYPGTALKALVNDLKEFRSAEMLLIRAEAAADANQLGMAATFVDQLRDARFGSDGLAPVYNNQTEAFGGILDERRLEFLFEGHRYIDLKRLGDRGGRTLDRDATECGFIGACTLSNTDFRFTLPIPIIEITGNPTILQNPGY